nr:hypothetical protein [Quadrisphaera sp. INWT6]
MSRAIVVEALARTTLWGAQRRWAQARARYDVWSASRKEAREEQRAGRSR